jgi:hypothetical protein
MMIKLDYINYSLPTKYLFFLMVLFLLYCCQPLFRCGYRTARLQLAKTIWEIMKSPFGRVRFRDFFFADIITSIGQTLVDLGTVFYFMITIRHDSEKN